MLLERISVNSSQFQYRETAFSESTVAGIVAEGIDLAKFDVIPVMMDGAQGIVAGDGHSRLEAIRRLAAAGRLPESWKCRGSDGMNGWDIPVRLVCRLWQKSRGRCARLSTAGGGAPPRRISSRIRLVVASCPQPIEDRMNFRRT